MTYFLPVAKSISLVFNHRRYIEQPILQGILDVMLAFLLTTIFTNIWDAKQISKMTRHSTRLGILVSVAASHRKPKASIVPLMSVGYCLGAYAGSMSFWELCLWHGFLFLSTLTRQLNGMYLVWQASQITMVSTPDQGGAADGPALGVELDRAFKMAGVMMASFAFALHSFWVIRMEERNQYRYGALSRARLQQAKPLGSS
mmetsp:Transcript_41774/g.65250  ORF Transcript_41774/g.65250 Transcript_41774/m.65250 type:complete len:201 (+) Transcript_41774:228-830(+)